MLDLVTDLQGRTCLVACARNHSVEGRRSSTRAENVGMIREHPPGDAAVVLERVTLRERDDQVLREEALAHQALARHRRSKNSNVDVSGLQGRYLLRGGEITQLDLDIGIPPGEEPDDARAAEKVRPEGATHEELTELPAARPLSIVRGLLRLGDQGPRFFQEHASGIGQLHASLRPVKKGGLQLSLEAPDLLAQGRLRDAQPRGGAPKMELLGDGEEVTQVAELHAATHITNVSVLPGKYIGRPLRPIASWSCSSSVLTGDGACPFRGRPRQPSASA